MSASVSGGDPLYARTVRIAESSYCTSLNELKLSVLKVFHVCQGALQAKPYPPCEFNAANEFSRLGIKP